MAALIADKDWSRTPLGVVEEWPEALRASVGLMLNSQFPMFMGWGGQLVMLYNDAYVPVLGDKHPQALGRPAEQVWAEIWSVLGPLAADVLAGRSNYQEDLLLVMRRHGFTEETYFTFSYSPIPVTGLDAVRPVAGNAVAGLFCACSETTGRVLGERRLNTLSELGNISAVVAPTVPQALTAVLDVLATNRADLPCVSAYVAETDAGGRVTAARLVGSYRMRVGSAIMPPVLPGSTGETSIWRVFTSGSAQVITGLRARYPGMYRPDPDGIDPQAPDVAVLLPIFATGRGYPVAVLVAGVSPFLALDEEYRRFFDLVAGQVGAAVTDALAYEAERARADALAELDRAKTEFFTGVSHELRTPLTLITGPAEDGLADEVEPLPPGQRARMELIFRNGGRLRRLVDTLLEFSLLEAGRPVPARRVVDLGVLTRGICESFAPAVARAGLSFAVDCPVDPIAVALDVEMWEKIVLNLLSNAVKFTLAGRVAVELRVLDGRDVELAVTDTGIGVAAAELPLLFRRFHRVRGAGGRSHEGSGIGLALVAELAELHGGTATATSTPGQGSRFVVTLPAAVLTGSAPQRVQASTMVSLYRDEALQWSAADAAGKDAGLPVVAQPHAATVLVAEDNADLRRFITGLLEPTYRVLVVGDGLAALEQVRRHRPDLVLTDVMMPGLDGFALLAAVRADPVTVATPIVLLSARAGQEAVDEGLAAGADDYLIKPFSSRDLLARVASNLAMARLRNHEGAWRTALVNSLRDGLFVTNPAGEVVEVSEGFTELVGYGPEGLPYALPHPWWPDADTDPDGFARVSQAHAEAGRTGSGRYLFALRHREGCRLWVDCSVTAIPDRDGTAQLLVGVVRDVTAAHRAAERDKLLAEVGRVLARSGELIEQLAEIVALAAPVLADQAVVFLAGPDDRLTPVAAADRSRPEVAAAVLARGPHRLAQDLMQAHRAGDVFVLEPVTWEAAADGTARAALAGASSLIAPLVVAGRLLGSLVFVSHPAPRRHDAADLALARELGRRVAAAIDADRIATRETHRQTITIALARAATVAEAAAALATGMVAATSAAGVAVYHLHPDAQQLDLVHTWGYPPEVAETFAMIHRTDSLPVADAARDGQPVWLSDQQTWQRRYPKLAVAPADTDAHAVAVLPLQVGTQVVGVLAASYPTARGFAGDEQQFMLSLASQAAQAFERAAVADNRWQLAQTLQRSLLPPTLLDLPGVVLTARYLPAANGIQAGGDWYDVLRLDERRIAIVVGDAVGQGPAAATVMGQLRSALNAYLREGFSPGRALQSLARFAAHVPGARVSTAICTILDTDTGELVWARAGHPPPLLVDTGGARYLDGARGTVLGIPDTPPYLEGRTQLPPGASVLLYTDGLVERRGETIDDGLDRLAAIVTAYHHTAVEQLVEAAVHAAIDGAGPADDIALILVRFLPAPLHEQIPACPEHTAAVRRVVRAWARAIGLDEDFIGDLQLVVSEAVTNAVEHAYLGQSGGEVSYRLDYTAGTVHAMVSDQGRWRPPPQDNGFRGRGLPMIRALTDDVSIDRSDSGTCVRFTMSPSPTSGARRLRNPSS